MRHWREIGSFELNTLNGDVKVPEKYGPLSVKVEDYELREPIVGKIEKLLDDDYYNLIWNSKEDKDKQYAIAGSGTCLEDALELFIDSLILEYEIIESKKEDIKTIIKKPLYSTELANWF